MEKLKGKKGLAISVIVPALNEEHYIGRTLQSLLKQNFPRSEYEIIVVDGKSKDKTVKIAKMFANRVYVDTGNSVSSARNLGAKRAKGKIVAFIDADSVPEKSWLERIKDAILSQGFDGVGGDTLPIEKDKEAREFYKALNFVQGALSGVGFFHFSGYNCAYDREKFLRIGGFNEKFRVSEDTDLSARFSKKFKCKYIPEIVVKTSYRRIRQLGAAKVVFMWLLGHYYISAGKPFPWDYGSMVKK